MGTDNANRAMHARTVKASHLLERRSRSPAMRCTSCVCEMIGAARRERYQVLYCVYRTVQYRSLLDVCFTTV